MVDVKATAKTLIRDSLSKVGLELRRQREFPPDLDAEFHPIWRAAREFTMTPVERGFALYKAVNYVVDAGVKGAFVECGVWRGGSSMVAAQSFVRRGEARKFWLFDTYAGMSAPTAEDVQWTGESAEGEWKDSERGDHNAWCYAPLDDVKANMARTGIAADDVEYVVGKVEDTLPTVDTGAISILRLDTDWYESTKAELDQLYPLLEPGGVILLDDYGFWQGARQAVDEFFAAQARPPLFLRVDGSCRVGVKPG